MTRVHAWLAWVFFVALPVVVLAANQVHTFSDPFTRADNADLGANWDNGYDTSNFASEQIVSNQVRVGSSPVGLGLETYAGSLGSDQFGGVTIKTFTIGTGSLSAGVMLRWAAPTTASGYMCLARRNSSFTSAIRIYTASSNSELVSENAITWGPDDLLECQIIGTTINMLRNGVQILTTTDSTYTSGRGGLAVFGNPIANAILDDAYFGVYDDCGRRVLETGTDARVTEAGDPRITEGAGGSCPGAGAVFGLNKRRKLQTMMMDE